MEPDMSAKVIKFPKAAKRRKKMTDVLVDRIEPSPKHTDLGHVPFTCPDCGQVASFDFSNLIFRQVTFYCGCCGHGYAVSNPMFAQRPRLVIVGRQG